MLQFPERLQKKLSDREASDALRTLRLNEGKIDFCSNDYLGFSGSRKLSQRVGRYLEENKIIRNGATGSRLLSGNSPLFQQLEEYLSGYYQANASLLFNSGYDANLGFFASVPQKGDLLLYDEFVHASIRDGIQMSHTRAFKFRHNDPGDLEHKLKRERKALPETKAIYVVTESVFSMDGDSPDLGILVGLCEKYRAYLVVDEAHAVGVYGEKGAGLVVAGGLQAQVFARIVTFGKAYGVHGAAVLGSRALATYLTNFARSFIYSTALPEHSLVSILQAHLLRDADYGLREHGKLFENIHFFKDQTHRFSLNGTFNLNNSPIQSFVLPENGRVKQIAAQIQAYGFDVRPILAPTVPVGKERIRFCLHSFNKKVEISGVLEKLKEFTQKL